MNTVEVVKFLEGQTRLMCDLESDMINYLSKSRVDIKMKLIYQRKLVDTFRDVDKALTELNIITNQINILNQCDKAEVLF